MTATFFSLVWPVWRECLPGDFVNFPVSLEAQVIYFCICAALFNFG